MNERHYSLNILLHMMGRRRRVVARKVEAVVMALVLAAATSGYAAESLAAAPSPANAGPSIVEPNWRELTPPQRELLAPLASKWNAFSEVRKRKWLGIVNRYPGMTPQEQLNVRQNMGNWSQLTSAQRENARTRYKLLRNMPPQALRALEKKWREYDALPEAQKEAMRQAQISAKNASDANAAALRSRAPKLIAIAP